MMKFTLTHTYRLGLFIACLCLVIAGVVAIVLVSDTQVEPRAGLRIDPSVLSHIRTYTDSTADDGVHTRIVYPLPQQYLDVTGSYVPIDTAIVTDGEAGFQNVTNGYQTRFTIDGGMPRTTIDIPGGRRITLSPEVGVSSDAVVTSDVISYTGTTDGLKLEQEVGLASLTQRLMITSGVNPFPLRVGYDMTRVSLQEARYGGWYARAADTGDVVLVIPEPIMFEYISDEDLDTQPSYLWSEFIVTHDSAGMTIDVDESGRGWLDSVEGEAILEIRYQHPLYAMQPGQLYRPGTTTDDQISSDPLASKYKVGHFWNVGAAGCPSCEIEYQFSGAANLYIDDDTRTILRQADAAHLALSLHRSGSAVESILPEQTELQIRFGFAGWPLLASPAAVWRVGHELPMGAVVSAAALPTDPPKTFPNCTADPDSCRVVLKFPSPETIARSGHLQLYLDPGELFAQEPGKFYGLYLFGPESTQAPHLVISYTP